MYTNMEKKKSNREFNSGGLHERHVVATWKLEKPSQHSLVDTGETSCINKLNNCA